MTTALVLVLASVACMEPVRMTPTAPPPTVIIPSHSEDATPTARATPVQTTAVNQIAVVLPALVNVRAEPGGEVVGQLEEGDSVQILICDYNICGDEWRHIMSGEITGYIFAGCLSIDTQLGCSAR